MTNDRNWPAQASDNVQPYALGASIYRSAGWAGVLPVDLNGAGAVPEGFTGGRGSWPDDAQITKWVASHGGANVGLRLPDDVIGIDVDCYDGKTGCRTLANLEGDFGPLPSTWRSTSRQDGSAIYLFRVPPGRSWISGDQDVEIIRYRHRWMRVPPSRSPKTGELYRWYAPDGTISTRPPRPDELPVLPPAWVERALAKNGKTSTSVTGATSPVGQDHESLDFDAWLRSGANVPGNQRDHLLRGVGWMRTRFYTRDSAIALAWQVASTYETRRPGDPWTMQDVVELVDDVWRRYPAGERPEPWMLQAGRNVVDAQPLAELPPEVGEALAARTTQVWIQRQAERNVDAHELAQARGERLKRTAREYAVVPQPVAVMTDVLAAEVNLLGGPSEAGKSLLARDWALCVASGYSWRGYGVPSQRNTLLIASEGLHDFNARWQTHPLWEQAADRIFILDEPVDLVRGGDVDWLLAEYDAERPGLVVLDVIYGMGLPDDNGVRDVVPLIAALKRISATWQAATLAVGHPGLNGERRFRGSSAWTQLAAVEWHMAEGALSCEKSKIADKRKLGTAYRAEYPTLHYLSPAEAVAAAGARQELIVRDFIEHPDDSDLARARRLMSELGVHERRARQLVRLVRENR